MWLQLILEALSAAPMVAADVEKIVSAIHSNDSTGTKASVAAANASAILTAVGKAVSAPPAGPKPTADAVG